MNRKSKLNLATYEAADNQLFSRMLRDALKLDFALSLEDHQALEAFYAPQLITTGTKRASDHPIGAAHLRFATRFAHDFALSHENIIEIGPSAVNFAPLAWGNPRAHGCTLFSARDQGRHVNAAMSATLRGLRPNAQTIKKIAVNGLDQKTYHDRVQALATGIPSHTFCTQGWEHCQFSAPVAISIHSLYDITIGQLALGMYNHGCVRVKAWMHFPVQALEVPEYSDFENMYRYKTRYDPESKEDVLDFNWLGDTSFGYQHSKATWLSYLQVGGIDTPFGFSLMIEKVKKNGSQFELDIHRVTSSGNFFYQIPNSMVNLVKVPNFREMAAKGFCQRQAITYIITDAEKVRKLCRFIYTRAEKGYSLETVKGFARTLVSEVRLGDRVAEHRWELTQDQFSDICISVYILTTFRKMIDERVIDKSFEYMAKIKENDSFWGRFSLVIQDALWKVLERTGLFYHRDLVALTGHGKDSVLKMDEGRHLFKKAFLDFYEDHDCYSRVTSHPLNFQVNFNFTPVRPAPMLGNPSPPGAPPPGANPNPPPTGTQPALVGAPNPSLPAPVQDWAHLIGVRTAFPQVFADDYEKEDHYEILLKEYQLGAAKAKLDGKTPLEVVLDCAATTLQEDMKARESAIAKQWQVKPYLLSFTNPFDDQGNVSKMRLIHENIAVVMGVPGSRKTTKVLKEVMAAHLTDNPNAKVMVIVPTSELKKTYEKTLVLPHRAYTPHTALAARKHFQPTLVIIDEAFTFPIAYINHWAMHNRVIAVGDPGQIGHCDFSGLWKGCLSFAKMQPFLPTMQLMTTYRCPQDVTVLPLVRKMYPGITSASAKISSIQHVHHSYVNASAQVLTFTQTEKACLIQRGVNASTVHEQQGATFQSVILHYAGTKAERDLLTSSPNHLIVGLTRHTNDLFIRDETAINNQTGELVKFINDSSPLSYYADKANMDLQSLDAANNARQITVEEDVHADTTPYPPAATDEAVVEQILVKYHGANLMEEHQHAMTTDIPTHDDAKGKLRLDNLGADEAFEQKKHTVHRFIASQRVKVTKPSDKRMLVKTMFDRLTVKTKSLPPVAAERMSKRLFDKVQEEFDWAIEDSNLHQVFVEACEKFQDRGHDMSKLLDIEDWKDMNVTQVKSFLKTQDRKSVV